MEAQDHTPQVNPDANTVAKNNFLQGHEIDPVHAARLTPLAEKMPEGTTVPKPDAPPGMSQEELARIVQGQPDPAAPQSPSEISPIKEMSLGELQQFSLSLDAKLDLLQKRFENLAADNFKAKY